MNILISACLLGLYCRYDGMAKTNELIEKLAKKHHFIPVCPEVYGGLPTPRDPAEQKNGQVITAEGAEVTAFYRRGAQEALRLAKMFDCTMAILKEHSPSCGAGEIYDGTFTGTLTSGDGVTAALLAANGVQVIGESRLAEMFRI